MRFFLKSLQGSNRKVTGKWQGILPQLCLYFSIHPPYSCFCNMHYLSKLCLFKVSLQLNSTWPDPLPDISLIPDMIQFWKIIWYHSIYPVNDCLVEGVRARNIPSTSVCDYSMYLLSSSACLCGRFIFPQDPSSPQILGRRRPHLDKYKSRHSAASLSNSFPHIRSAWTLPHTRLHVQLYSVHCTMCIL